MRNDLRALTVATLAGLTFVVAAGTANAQSSRVVQVPEHPIDTTLTLLGASTRGVAVQQGAPSYHSPTGDYDSYLTRRFSGPEGSELVRRPGLEASSVYDAAVVLGVVGDTLAWQENRSGHYIGAYVHRMNVRTGKDVLDGRMPSPLAFTGTQWLSDAPISYDDYPFPPSVLRRYQSDGSPPDRNTLLKGIDIIPDSGITTALAADDSTALQVTLQYSDLTQYDGAPRYSLDLVDLVHGTKQTMADSSPAVITGVALSATTIAWNSQVSGGPLVIHERPRAGGDVTSYTDPDPQAVAAHLAVSDGSAAYLVGDAGHTVMRVVTGDSAQTVDVPDGSSGIGAVGDRFLTAVGGPASVAGVYSDDGGTVTRVATVPSRTYPLTSLAMSGSKIFYTDGTSAAGGPSLWQRTITGTNRPILGPESLVATEPVEDADLREARDISFSAGRGAVVSSHHDWSWHLLDRGKETGAIPATDHVKVSGPYALSNGKVYGTEGNLVYTEPTTPGASIVGDDIFGSSIVYAVRYDNGQDSEIWLDNVEHPGPVQLADEPSSSNCFGYGPYLAIWGNTVAWDGCNGSGVTVENIVTRGQRDIGSTFGQPVGKQVVLGEGVLAWQDALGTNVVDLNAAGSLVPVVLSGSAMGLVLDGHWIARQLTNQHGYPSGYDIQTLPFDGKSQPRLIGVAAPLGFTPDGDGHGDTWKPQYDITKPMRIVKLTISDPATGKVLRTLDGSAPDGSVRDLSWDGLTKKGAVVPTGTYRWTLTGRASDGGGALLGPLGQNAVQGTIEIDGV